MTKRLFDIVASLAALLLLSPLLLGTALAVALESGFPVLFRQTRVGRHGRGKRAQHLFLRAELPHLAFGQIQKLRIASIRLVYYLVLLGIKYIAI